MAQYITHSIIRTFAWKFELTDVYFIHKAYSELDINISTDIRFSSVIADMNEVSFTEIF